MIYKKLLEELTSDTNQLMKKVEQVVMNSKVLDLYLLKVMPFPYKKGYSVNVMMNDKFKKLENKEKIVLELETIAKDNNAKLSNNDQVFKITFKQ